MRVSKSDLQIALLRSGSKICPSISKDLSYHDNVKLLSTYFYHHLDEFISCLSINTYGYLKELSSCKDKDMSLRQDFIFNEDFFFLFELGVLNVYTFKVTPLYKKVVNKLLAIPCVDKMVNVYTLLKGIIDVYGYITFKGMASIVNEFTTVRVSMNKLYNYCHHNHFINYKCKVTHKDVRRNEIMAMWNDFAFAYEQFDNKIYSSYPLETYLNFASSFSLDGTLPFNEEQNYALMNSKVLSLVIFSKDMLLDDVFKTDEDKKALLKFNHAYPKWLLKGGTPIGFVKSQETIFDYPNKVYA